MLIGYHHYYFFLFLLGNHQLEERIHVEGQMRDFVTVVLSWMGLLGGGMDLKEEKRGLQTFWQTYLYIARMFQ